MVRRMNEKMFGPAGAPPRIDPVSWDHQDVRHGWLETTPGDLLTIATITGDSRHVSRHMHSRSQLLHVRSGVVLFRTDDGRWMVPPGHAMWIPAGTPHAVDMPGGVWTESLYVRPGAFAGLPGALRVVAVGPLQRLLIAEAMRLEPDPDPDSRAGVLKRLLLHEIAALPEAPLSLAFPTDPRIAALCRSFLADPAQAVAIDDWAARAGMSRRTFTRHFQKQTGLGLSAWRQQACLFAALPRLAAGEAVTTVALDLGYESVPAFTTMFKRLLGAPPRDYFAAGRSNPSPASR